MSTSPVEHWLKTLVHFQALADEAADDPLVVKGMAILYECIGGGLRELPALEFCHLSSEHLRDLRTVEPEQVRA